MGESCADLACKSVFEPTMTQGMPTSVVPQKSTILSWMIWTMLNELREVTE